MASPVSQAYSETERRHSPYLTHKPPRIMLTGLDIPAHPEFDRSWPLWRTVRDCYEGEHVIKAQRETYLPRLTAHKRPEEYDAFLRRAYFYNAVRRTAVGLMGSLFRKLPEFTIPPRYSALDLSNVTLESQSAEEFCKLVAGDVVLTGRYGILADMPVDDPDRPYLAGYAAESVYSWREMMHRGRKIVDRVVLWETEVVRTEYGEATQDVIRILRLDPDEDGNMVYWQQIFRPSTDPSVAVQRQDVQISVVGRSLDYIPFVFVNVTHNLPSVQQPTLLPIASINVSHYQSTALLEHARFYAGMPTYVTSAGTGQAQDPALETGGTMSSLTVGPSNVWELEEGAKAWILEFNGHGLVFLENAVDSKQLQMQSLGGKLISAQRKAAALSSEAWTLLETGDEATLMDVAISVENGMAKALTYLADLQNLNPVPDQKIVVELNKEFVRSDLTARELRALQALFERQIIPVDIMYYALREVNVIPIEYSLEDFKALMGKKDQLYEPPVVEASFTGTASRPGAGVRPQASPSAANNPPSGSSP